MKTNAGMVAEEIILLLNSKGGSEYIGEPLSKLEHMVQSAVLAEEQKLGDEMIIAALLHDIGHICVDTTDENDMGGCGVIDHEATGADFLRERGFSERIASAVANHVPAKRYLCFKYPDYNEALSGASKKTLEFQGGPMMQSEADVFEKLLYFNDIIALRRIDELAKIENIPLPENLDMYKKLMIEHLKNNG